VEIQPKNSLINRCRTDSAKLSKISLHVLKCSVLCSVHSEVLGVVALVLSSDRATTISDLDGTILAQRPRMAELVNLFHSKPWGGFIPPVAK